MVIYTYIAPGQGQTTPQGLKFYTNINLLSICLFPVIKCLPSGKFVRNLVTFLSFQVITNAKGFKHIAMSFFAFTWFS